MKKFFILLRLTVDRLLASFPFQKKHVRQPGEIQRPSYLQSLVKSLYSSLRGLPQVSYSEISGEIIQDYVGKPDPTILEIGCNDGSDTLRLLEMFDNPKLYCFEPDPRAIAQFKVNVGQRSNVNLFEFAISNHDGDIKFYQSGGRLHESPEGGWNGSSSIKQPKIHLDIYPDITFEKEITVKSLALDTWCKENGINVIDFIWMDVQGAEIDVFRGGMNALAKTRFIYTEYGELEYYKGQYTLKKLLKYLDHFEILIRYPGDVLLRNMRLI